MLIIKIVVVVVFSLHLIIIIQEFSFKNNNIDLI